MSARNTIVLLLCTAPALVLATWLSAAQSVPVVNDRALEYGAGGQEWISYNVNWKEQRYSPLAQINENNVERLGLAWSYDIPPAAGDPENRQEATPLVHNGVLYSIEDDGIFILAVMHLRRDPDYWKHRL